MQKIIKIVNLDCAACAAELQEELEKIQGVEEASVDFVGQRVSLTYASREALEKAIDSISHFEEVEIVDGNAPKKKESRFKDILVIVISLALFLPALVIELVSGGTLWGKWTSFGLYLGAVVAAGWVVLWNVCKNVAKAFRGGFRLGILFDENLLMLIASIGAFALGENMEGAIVMILYQIGELLQSVAVGSSRGAIEKLVFLKSETAYLADGREISPDELKEGDMILIRRGDKVPADCVLTEGETSLDTKSLTGEAYFREVAAGDELLAGCVNEGNVIKAKVLRPSSESAVAKILAVVENSSAKKAKPEKFITRFARIYTPVVVLCALIVAILPPLIIDMHVTAVWSEWILRALNFLVISCPCALIISVPLTYFSGVGSLARCGVLVKGAVYLDTLARVKTAAFDKTGTLTEGKFTVSKVHGEEAYLLAAAVEKNSSHPLAQAFAGVETPYTAQNVEEIAGMGLSATVDGKLILVGSERLMRENGVAVKKEDTLSAVIYVAKEGEYLGCVEIEDKLKADAAEAIEALKRAGITRTAVLTGDSRERAEAALAGVAIDKICAGLLPEEKPVRARELKAEGALMYVGDGINDTPVMAESDLAVSMGSLGSDAAVEASDMVLASDSLSALPKAVRGAKKTRKIVLENIVFSVFVKIALMAFSVVGWIPLWAAVLGDVGVMLLAVLNSLRMRAKIK